MCKLNMSLRYIVLIFSNYSQKFEYKIILKKIKNNPCCVVSYSPRSDCRLKLKALALLFLEQDGTSAWKELKTKVLKKQQQKTTKKQQEPRSTFKLDHSTFVISDSFW